jgi:putative oxidoreductase
MFYKKKMTDFKLQFAEMLVRGFTGILFLFQGCDKLFRIKIGGVVRTFAGEAELHHISKPLVSLLAVYTSVIEFFCGILLIVGLFTQYNLYLLGFDLLFVCIAFSVLDPVWDMRHVFPRLVLIAALLIFPSAWNTISLDSLLQLNR